MTTQLFIKTFSQISISSFSNVGGFLAFTTTASGLLNIGQSVSINTNVGIRTYYISNISGDLHTTSTLWDSNSPSSGTIQNVLVYNEPNGDIDTTFNSSGAFNGRVVRVIQDSAGRLICVGDFTTYKGVSANRIIRLFEDGSRDSTFVIGSGFNNVVRALYLDQDGSIFVGGSFTTYDGVASSGIIKLTTTGSIDTSFNVGTGFTNLSAGALTAYDIDKLGDNYIIVGSFTQYNGVQVNGIVQVNNIGVRQTSIDFGTAFGSAPPPSDRAYSVLVDGDSLYVGGNFLTYKGTPFSRLIKIITTGVNAGSVDITFNPAQSSNPQINANITKIKKIGSNICICGFFTQYLDINGTNLCRGIAFLTTDGDFVKTLRLDNGGTTNYEELPNGKGYAFGTFTQYDSQNRNRIVRVNSDGSIDPTFFVNSGFNNDSNGIIDQSTGSIYGFGSFTSWRGVVNNLRIIKLFGSTTPLQNKPTSIDLREDLQFPITYSISDIRNPQNRKSNFTKTVVVPGTKNNNKIFTQQFEVGSDGSFDPRIKIDCFVIQDGLEILNGYLKLESVRREDWNKIEYNLKIFGEVSDLFSRLKKEDGSDLLLSDLDLSEYTHKSNANSVIDSWKGDIQKSGASYSSIISTFIDNVTDTAFSPGGRTVFLISDPSSLSIGDVVRFEMDNPNDISVNFQDSWGCHTITDFIDISGNSVLPTSLSCIGPVVNLRFQSGATNSGDLYLEEVVGDGYVYPTLRLDGEVTTGLGGADYINIKTGKDELAIFNRGIVDKIFTYIGFEWSSNFFDSQYFKRTLTNAKPIIAEGSVNFNNILFTSSPGQDESLPMDNDSEGIAGVYSYEVTFDIYKESPLLGISGWLGPNDLRVSLRFQVVGGSGNVISTIGVSILNNITNFQNANTFIFGNNLIGTIQTPNLQIPIGGFVRTSVILNSAFIIPLEDIRVDSFTYGDSVYPMLPDMKVSDWLKSMINHFNLYIQPEQFNLRRWIIEPFDLFYNQGVIDWTSKVDISSDIEIKPLAPDTSKNFKWSYKNDSDFYNKKFFDDFKNAYGYYNTQQPTEFNNNTTEFKSEFSQTPLVDLNTGGSLIVPQITKESNRARVDKISPRIFYWTGVRSIKDIGLINTPNVFINQFSTITYYPLKVYGYAGHMDNPKDATLDLNFGQPQNLYYWGGTYDFFISQNTLYWKFYRNYINEITDKNTKSVSMFIKLNSYDITSLSFRKLYSIRDQLYRLVSINDYDPLNNSVTKCEFINVKSTVLSDPTRYSVSLGGILTEAPVRKNVFGDGNTIEVRSSTTVIGDNNKISTGVNNSYVMGNDNIIGDGISASSNIITIGNSITSTQSNGIYLGNENADIIIGGNLSIDKFDIDATIRDYILDDLNIGDGFNNNDVYSISIQSDGKILVGGGFTAFDGNVRNRLVRLNSDGAEDTGFYTNLGTGFDDLVRSISIQSDGKILVGGAFTDFDGNTRNRLVRLNSDGTEDTGFYTNLGTGFDATIWSISIQSDGKILVGGEFEDFDGNTRNRLVRLNSDGTEDTGFYTNLGTGFNNPVLSIKVQLNTKILVCGSFNGFDANVRNYLVRLNSDGTEDTGFYANLGDGFDIPVYSLEIQPDGLILVGGDFNDFDGNVRNYLVRLNSDGTEDTGFYANLGDGFDNRVWSIKVQLDAKILVGGGFTDLDGNTRNRLVRLNSDGTEDTGFYNNLGLGFNLEIYSLELQSDEKILVGGGFTAFDGNTRNGLVRLSELEESKIEIKSDIIEIGMSQSITTFSGQLFVNSISIDEVINLKPLSATPSNPIEGTIFYRQSVGIRFYDGANWRTIDFT